MSDTDYGFPEPARPTCPRGHQLAVENGWCKVCSMCAICQKSLTPTEYFWCLREAVKLEEPPTFEHPGCLKEMDKLTLASDSVRIPQALFNKLNACRLIIEALEDRNVRTNELDADVQTLRWMHLESQGKSHDEYMEYLYVVLRRMESSCATVSLAVSKARRAIEGDLASRDRENYQKALKQRAEQKSPRVPPMPSVAQIQAKAEKKTLTKEQKFLETYMRQTGLSVTDAQTSLDELNRVREARKARQAGLDEAAETIN